MEFGELPVVCSSLSANCLDFETESLIGVELDKQRRLPHH